MVSCDKQTTTYATGTALNEAIRAVQFKGVTGKVSLQVKKYIEVDSFHVSGQ